ncbi:MAG: hypothetical protein ACKVJ5_21855 [Pseudoalteromonas sp.]
MDIVFAVLTYMGEKEGPGLVVNALVLTLMPLLVWYSIHIKSGKTEKEHH